MQNNASCVRIIGTVCLCSLSLSFNWLVATTWVSQPVPPGIAGLQAQEGAVSILLP